MKRAKIVVSMGDPAGVGPEITLRACAAKRVRLAGTALVVGDIAVLRELRDRLALDLEFEAVGSPAEAATLLDARSAPDTGAESGAQGPDGYYRPAGSEGPISISVLDVGFLRGPGEIDPGRVSARAGGAALEYIRQAVELCLEGAADGLCTGPINKEALRASGADYIGHTEMISQTSGGGKGITMFLLDSLRIFFHSRHLSLHRAIDAVDRESVLESLLAADRCLRSVGVKGARIALAALNPHASDGGLFGDEEERFLIPACEDARRKGLDVTGPVPADSVFAQALAGDYEAVLSLYHDQGHIAAKSRNFLRTVSLTFGYPFLRSSVDHGTAFDIAWSGRASPESMEEALLAAFRYAPRYRPDYLVGRVDG